MNKLILYSYYRSSASYRVRIGLYLKNLPFSYRSVHLLKDGGEQNQDPYRRLNPQGQVPCLVDGEFALSQSMAILQYLDRKYPTPQIFPRDDQRFAQVVQICEMINSGIQPLQNIKVLQKIDRDFKVGNDGKNAWAAFWIEQGLQALEATLAKTSATYCLGDQVTAADLFLVPQMYASRRFTADVSRYPTLLRIERACLDLEAFQRADPEVQPDTPEIPT